MHADQQNNFIIIKKNDLDKKDNDSLAFRICVNVFIHLYPQISYNLLIFLTLDLTVRINQVHLIVMHNLIISVTKS